MKDLTNVIIASYPTHELVGEGDQEKRVLRSVTVVMVMVEEDQALTVPIVASYGCIFS